MEWKHLSGCERRALNTNTSPKSILYVSAASKIYAKPSFCSFQCFVVARVPRKMQEEMFRTEAAKYNCSP